MFQNQSKKKKSHKYFDSFYEDKEQTMSDFKKRQSEEKKPAKPTINKWSEEEDYFARKRKEYEDSLNLSSDNLDNRSRGEDGLQSDSH